MVVREGMSSRVACRTVNESFDGSILIERLWCCQDVVNGEYVGCFQCFVLHESLYESTPVVGRGRVVVSTWISRPLRFCIVICLPSFVQHVARFGFPGSSIQRNIHVTTILDRFFVT